MERINFSGVRYFRKALKILIQSAPYPFLLQTLLILLQGLLPLALIWLMKLIVDAASDMISNGINRETDIIIYVVLSAAVFFLNSACNSIQMLVKETINQKVSDRITELIHKKSISLDLSYYENSDYYNIYHRAVGDALHRPIILANNILAFMQAIISLVLVAIFLGAFHWGIPLLLIVASLPIVMVRLNYASRMYRWKYENAEEERKAMYYNRVVTSKPYAKELRLFGLGDFFSKSFMETRKSLRKGKLSILAKRVYIEIGANLIVAALVFACYAYVIQKAAAGNITVGDLVLFFFLFQRGLIFLRDFINSFIGLYEDNLFLSNIIAFLNLKPLIKESKEPKIMPAKIKDCIEFKDVNFAYPNSRRTIIKDLNLKIHSGETVAIVGENGAGKTTLIKLLCRLYEPDSGSILIDKTKIEDISIASVRRGISVIFQDFILYNATAAENIKFGDVNAPADLERIEKAAKQAGIAEILQGLPEGYNTMLGKLFANSEELSIGEWQKLALSRAFFRNSDIIILDEPTSALDPKAEFHVFKSFRELTKGKTCIIISHRFSTVKMADNILVLDKGSIVEQGTHTDLMEMNGKYSYLYDIQAVNYR